jgi:carboxyl-terminal processing protease
MKTRPCARRRRCSLASRIRHLIALALLAGRPAPAASEAARWTDDESMLAFFQAAREICDRGLATNSVGHIARSAMNAYLRDTDPYARFLGPEEYRRLRDAALENYGGVGMEIFQDGAGAVRCLPYPEGPADISGVREGDALVSVDGEPVPAGENILLTGARVRGPAGSGVRLGLRRPDGSDTQVLLFRDRVQARTLLPAGTNTFRVLAFETRTPDELRAALSRATPGATVVLDLRGNPGGSLGAAIDCARLFLRKDMTVVEVRTRAGVVRHAAREDGPLAESPPVVLWQDGGTASAAEVFIAALTGNKRARSVGVTTRGKGVTQRTTELLNGGALIFTDGRLIPPDGREYHGKGLTPGVILVESSDDAHRAASERIGTLVAPAPTTP